MPSASRYTILVPGETRRRAEELLAELRLNPSQAGSYLQAILAGVPMESLAPLDLLALLFDTRRPQIFAESEVAGDGSDDGVKAAATDTRPSVTGMGLCESAAAATACACGIRSLWW